MCLIVRGGRLKSNVLPRSRATEGRKKAGKKEGEERGGKRGGKPETEGDAEDVFQRQEHGDELFSHDQICQKSQTQGDGAGPTSVGRGEGLSPLKINMTNCQIICSIRTRSRCTGGSAAAATG